MRYISLKPNVVADASSIQYIAVFTGEFYHYVLCHIIMNSHSDTRDGTRPGADDAFPFR